MFALFRYYQLVYTKGAMLPQFAVEKAKADLIFNSLLFVKFTQNVDKEIDLVFSKILLNFGLKYRMYYDVL